MKKMGVLILCLMFILPSCGKSNKTVMSIGDEKLTDGVLRFYAYNTQASYESYYYACGAKLNWDKETSGETLEEEVKASILEDIKRTYILTNHASDFSFNKGSVTDDELKERVKEFNDETSEKLKKKINISDEELKSVLKHQILYEKIGEKIKQDKSIKADPDENRQVKIRFMELPETENGEIIAANITDKIIDGMSMEGEAKANGLEVVTGTLGKGDRDGDDFENTVLNMKDGEYDYAKSDGKYIIINCVDSYDEEATEVVCKDLEDKLLNTKIDEIIKDYDDKVKLNEKEWEKISLSSSIWSDEELEQIASEVSKERESDDFKDVFAEDEYASRDTLDPVYTYLGRVTYENEEDTGVDSENISLVANAAFLVDMDSMEILYSKNGDEQVAPASTTKMLTALTTLEFLDPNEVITVGEEINLIAQDASTAYLEVGDKLTVRELMTGMLICSGNDAAYCLAYNAGKAALNRKEGGDIYEYNGSMENIDFGDEDKDISACLEEFYYYMNLNASLIGCKNVCFLSPDGYDTEGQFVTASDLARIGVAAKENDEISTICMLESYYVESKDIMWQSTNKLIDENGYYYYPEADGLKTGSTGDAGKCFVATAEDNDNRVLSVVLGSDDSGRWEDTIRLLDYGLDNDN